MPDRSLSFWLSETRRIDKNLSRRFTRLGFFGLKDNFHADQAAEIEKQIAVRSNYIERWFMFSLVLQLTIQRTRDDVHIWCWKLIMFPPDIKYKAMKLLVFWCNMQPTVSHNHKYLL